MFVNQAEKLMANLSNNPGIVTRERIREKNTRQPDVSPFTVLERDAKTLQGDGRVLGRRSCLASFRAGEMNDLLSILLEDIFQHIP